MNRSLHSPWAVLGGLAVVVLLMLGFLLASTHLVAGPDISLIDPDNYMRLLRVELFWNGAGWHDNLIPYTNVPHGEILHWSRPLDLLIIATSLPFMPFMAAHDALFLGGVLISPILMMAILLVMSWGTRPYISNGGFVLICALMMTQPVVRNYTFFGRADHHALLLFLFTALFFATVRALGAEQHRPRAFYGLGLLAAGGLWVSVEALVGTFVICLGLGVLWLMGRPNAVHDLARYLVGVLGGTALFIAIDRPATDWLVVHYDRLSIVHLTLFAGFAAVWCVISAYEKRSPASLGGMLVLGAIGVAVPSTLLIAVFPDFLAGPYADVPAEVMDKWFSRISEVVPAWPSSFKKAASLSINLGPVVPAAYWIWRQCQRSESNPGTSHLAVLLGSALLAFSALALLQIRWAIYAEVLLPVPWALLLISAMSWTGGIARKDGTKVPMRSLLFLAILTTHVLVATGFLLASEARNPEPANQSGENDDNQCRDASVARWLENRSTEAGRPLNVMTFVHDGPEFVWRTQGAVRIVASPYHRNYLAILDTLNFWNALDHDDAFKSAHDIYLARRIDYMVFCIHSPAAKAGRKDTADTLFRALDSNKAPSWLAEINIPGSQNSNIRVFSVPGAY